MTITIEEVKKLAIKCGFGISCNTLVCNITDLQAFYQRAYEDGRKMQREKDHITYLEILKIALRDMEAIRNNTGE